MANAQTRFTDSEFQREVSKLLLQKGWRQKDVADHMGIKQPAISSALRGRSPGLLARVYQELTGRHVIVHRIYEVD